MATGECNKVTKSGRRMVVCHLPLGHEPQRRVEDNPPQIRLVVTHEGMLDGTSYRWDEELG